MEWLIYLGIIILVIFSFLFSGTEIAFTSLNIGRIRLEAESGDVKKKKTYDLAKNFSSVLYTVLVGNNLVNIAVSSLTTLLALRIVERSNTSLPVQTITVVITTVVILIFGEITPKLVANDNPNRFAVNVTWMVKIFVFIFKPVVFLVTKMTEKLSKLWKPKKEEPSVTEDELLSIVETIEEEGGFTQKESDLIKSAIEFSDDLAFEILTPRVDVFAINIDDDPKDIIQSVLEEEYSRVPVYKGTIDNIVGILSTKKLLKAAVKKGSQIDIRTMMREPLYIYKAMGISSVMEEFKAKRAHMAIVLDEFGGTMGIVTLEDVLEQLVGDIWDETDDLDEETVETSTGTYEIAGDMLLDDFLDMIEYEEDDYESEYTTVGGFVTEMLGHLPNANDSFLFDGHVITVLEVVNMRVEKVRVEARKNAD
ncbi:MAG: hemolysin family protein [Clostridia bacterium]|jgi:CBS domain containing-hemolysin-like protein|nr:HlyC/CorC family transporter [Clostridia bacterium]NLV34052.1 HlyC/CorC family transporter [Clostridiaceae bacterium]HQM95919.1 hemolysin family protein [Clostridia bacterium]HQO69226.1 hemolysin family protein [Clostridia bacterium]